MYANAPHASATTPSSPALQQHQALQQAPVQQGHAPVAPAYQTAPVAHQAQPMHAAAAPRSTATTYVTGAYQPSGDPAIDRMLRLEAACKRFGSLQ